MSTFLQNTKPTESMNDSAGFLGPVTTIFEGNGGPDILRALRVRIYNKYLTSFESEGKSVNSEIWTLRYFEDSRPFQEVRDSLIQDLRTFIEFGDQVGKTFSHTFPRCSTVYNDKVAFFLLEDDAKRQIYLDVTGCRSTYEGVVRVLEEKHGLDPKDTETPENLKLKFCTFDKNRGTITMRGMDVRSDNLPFTEMYPFLEGETLHQYYERFHNSDSPILLLRGPKGTGKSSFLRGLLLHTKAKALMTFDPDLIAHDSFIVDNFIFGLSDYFIVEDADTFLTKRVDGNNFVSKFLNWGDGIVSNPKKKIIFTTNLEVEQIDEALIRPGRCFDVLEFKPLTRSQAEIVAERKGIDLNLPEQNVSIAELFNNQKYTRKDKKTMGFLS